MNETVSIAVSSRCYHFNSSIFYLFSTERAVRLMNVGICFMGGQRYCCEYFRLAPWPGASLRSSVGRARQAIVSKDGSRALSY